MKFFAAAILTALLSFTVCLYFPWWTVAIVAFVVAIIVRQAPWKSFLAAFFGVFFLWFGISFLLSNANGHALAHRMSMVVLKMDNIYLLMLATALIGALVAAFAAASGAWVRKVN